MSKLRNYVRVYDNVLDDLQISEVYDKVAEIGADLVDVPGITRYEMAPLSPVYQTRKLWNSFSHHFCGMLTQYKADLGLQHEHRWSEDVFEMFTYRRYLKGEGFQEFMFDARSETTAPLFISGIYFLNDADTNIEFDASVAAPLVKAKKGRLVLFPSNWMFPYSFKTGDDDMEIVKASMRWKEPRT